ncbi:MAG: cupin domain-containing protein [Pyrinomonadaceae bacterium]
MAILSIPDKKSTLREADEIKAYLANIGIDYEKWRASYDVSPDASEEEILQAYSAEIEKLKIKGGYTTADVIDLKPTTPNLDEMLEKFRKEHWHDEDEVRFIIKGHGLFHIAPEGGDIISIEMEAGDLICVPKGTLHWFNLCGDKNVRAIRLFQNPAGWTPFYTESGTDGKYQPVCLGVNYIPVAKMTA